MKRFAFVLVLLFGALFAVYPQASTPLVWRRGTPPGGVGAACTDQTHAYLTATGQQVSCVSGVWTAASGSGGTGTVTHTCGALTSGYIIIGQAGADICIETGAYFDGSNNLVVPAGVKSGGTATGAYDFGGTTSGVVTVTVADAAGTHTIKLPTTTGAANSLIKTDGSGQWGWTSAPMIRSSCFDFGADNGASDLVDADIGPQSAIFKVPVALTIIEASVQANAGTPSMPILQKLHWGGSSWAAVDLTSVALATGSAGIETCAATGAACISGVAKDGTTTIVTAGSANVLAAGDYIQTKTGSGFASTGAKRMTVCVTYTLN